jgi:hypothetical protein
MRNENLLVRQLNEGGIHAERVPLSGSAHGSFGGDVMISGGRKIEVKVRGDGFRTLYDWIEGNYILAVRSDRRDWLTVVRLTDLMALMRAVEDEDEGEAA